MWGIRGALTVAQMPIPPKIHDTLLPKADLNVVDLCRFSIPEDKNGPELHTLPNENLFSKTASMVTDGCVTFLQSLPMPTTPQLEILQARFDKCMESNTENGIQSLLYSFGTSTLRLPLWVLDYWREANIILEQKLHWDPAVYWLKRRKQHEAIKLLTELPWRYRMPKTMGDHISDLALFCSEKWLKGSQVDTMLEILRDHLRSERIEGAVKDVDFLQKLVKIYRHTRDTYADDNTAAFIRAFMEKLKTGEVSVVGLAVAVRYTGSETQLPFGEDIISNHWCSFVIDTNERTIHYGDSLGAAPPPELLDVLNWWLGLSFPTPFSLIDLPITQQTDSFSCAVFAVNALSHYFLPLISPLLPNGLCLSARVEALIGAVNLLKRQVRYFNQIS
jgi:hypothetical protein